MFSRSGLRASSRWLTANCGLAQSNRVYSTRLAPTPPSYNPSLGYVCRRTLSSTSHQSIASTLAKPAPKSSKSAATEGDPNDGLSMLEHEHARIIRVVERRIDERKRIMSLISADMSGKDDVAHLKKVKEMEPLQEAWDQYCEARKLLKETQELLNDPDPSMRSMASDEYLTLLEILETTLTQTLPSLLLPPSATAHFNALLEIKSGVGGSESSLFVGDLLRMYTRFAQEQGWKAEIVAQNNTDDGGIKDVTVEITGGRSGIPVYDSLRWESGVHRVQRVPATETKGRTHTSAVAVLVLPLVEESAKEGSGDEELFKQSDIKVEVMRARGAGGQHVNKTESAVRLTHVPTGITVSMQDERSQHQNRRRAYQVLRSRLLDRKLQEEMLQRRDTRRNLVSGADRSDKIRTYNFAQERVTDHRIGLSVLNLSSVLEGRGIDEFVDALKKSHEQGVMESMFEDAQ